MSILEFNMREDSIIYDLNHYTTILVGRHGGGRKPDIIIPDIYKFVSRTQCGFTLFPFESGDKWVIKDGSLVSFKNSSFGTYVNNIKLGDIEIRRLNNGDIITFANQPCPYIKFICEELDSVQIKEEQHPTGSHEFAERSSE